MIESVNTLQNRQRWTLRLLINSLFVLAIVSLALPSSVSAAFGFSENGNQILLATAPGFSPVAIGKTSQSLKSVRKHSPAGAGPDIAPDFLVFGNIFAPDQGADRSVGGARSVYNADHILFRNGSRPMSVRAPPVHSPD